MRWYDLLRICFCFTLVGTLVLTTDSLRAAQTEPAPTEPAPTEPASTEPAPTEPALAEPAAPDKTETKSPPKPDTRHISLRPYRIRIELAYATDCRLTEFDRQQIQSRLPQFIERSAGEKWALTSTGSDENAAGIYVNDWLPLPTVAGLDRLSTEAILKHYPTQAFDKLFLLTVESAGIGFQLSGREFDVDSQQLGPLVKKTTYARPFLAETSFQILRDLFSAVVTIESVEGDQAIVSEQGSQFLTPDPTIGTLQKQDFFVPFFRYLNRNREVKNIQMIPWTYLILEEVDRKHARCSISSGLRGILSSSRRRVEMQAIRVAPHYPETRLSLVPRGTAAQTYAGMRVQLSPLNPQEVRQLQIAAKKESEETGKPVSFEKEYITGELLTNRNGTITVSANPAEPLIWLYVRSGKALVANVPYIPGIAPRAAIQVPDDRIRLGLEGDLAVLNGELIEAVAALSMQMSRIRKWAKNNEWKKVDRGIRELESGISPRKTFQDKLTVIRVTATEAAQEQKNRAAESRIASLCRETETRINRFLDPTGIVDFKAEIKDLRQLQEQSR
ncbi:hypothetical protein Enr10x_33240 [Gimesia panareensis]|uniref:DUF4384 domain-containing protein n=1 Tax=Gimesia panareensis TaxID=2527978 RepID=A0A517Q8P7_9PLAN|nr:hypothetical protein [Gimesia panareensis]QDT27987.1 hypothetical protein Enr10x_33240 [Gimesia panareensis]